MTVILSISVQSQLLCRLMCLFQLAVAILPDPSSLPEWERIWLFTWHRRPAVTRPGPFRKQNKSGDQEYYKKKVDYVIILAILERFIALNKTYCK